MAAETTNETALIDQQMLDPPKFSNVAKYQSDVSLQILLIWWLSFVFKECAIINAVTGSYVWCATLPRPDRCCSFKRMKIINPDRAAEKKHQTEISA